MATEQNLSTPAAATGRLAYLPVGSFEQHGKHLPYTTDTLVAEAIVEEMNKVYPGLVLPAVPVTSSHEHSSWRGTVSVPFEVSGTYIRTIVDSLLAQRYNRIIFVSGHGGNYHLSNLVQELNKPGLEVILFPTSKAYNQAFEDAGLQTSPHSDMHAGELETSLGLYKGFAVTEDIPKEPYFLDDRELLTTVGLQPYSKDGYIGAPNLATKKKGKKVLESYVTSFGRILDILAKR